MSFSDTFQDRMEGVCLTALGGLMAALALSQHYWYFLNPRFMPLTLGCGAALVLVGLVPLLRPRPGRATTGRLIRQAVLLGFLSLAAYAWEQATQAPPAGAFTPRESAQAQPQMEPDTPVEPEVERGGVRYTRLNLAELYIMVDKGRTDFPRHVALRIQTGSEPALEKHGLGLATRITVVCCLADSMQLGFLATGLEGAEPGQWLEVYGSLKPLDARGKAALGTVEKGSGPSLKVVNPKFLLAVDSAEPTPPPSFPYLFEFNEKPPFAW